MTVTFIDDGYLYQGSGANIVINVPGNTLNNDVMVVFIGSGNTGSITAPGGWTAITASINWVASTWTARAWYRVASSEPASYTWTVASGNVSSAIIRVYRNVNTTTPINAFNSLASANGTGTSLQIPALTETVAAGELYVACWFQTVVQAFTMPADLINQRVYHILGCGDKVVNTTIAETASTSAAAWYVGIGVTLNPGAALQISDRVRDTSTTSGTGALTLTGTAPASFRTFSSVCNVNDTIYYCIASQTQNTWETGLGTYSASNTLTRTTVLASSNANAAVSFGSETKDVMGVIPAGMYPLLQQTNNTYQVSSAPPVIPGAQNLDFLVWNIQGADTSATCFNRVSKMQTNGPNAITGAGHAGALIGWIQSQTVGTHDGLHVGLEGRLQNDCETGTLNNSVAVIGDMAGNRGTLTNHINFYSECLSNSGTITALYGFAFASLAGNGNVGTITNSYSFANLDATSPIVSNSPIYSPIAYSDGFQVELAGPKHPGLVTGRYYYGSSPALTAFTATALTANTIIFAPFFCPIRKTFTKIGCRVTTGGASSNIQLAIYHCGNGVPRSLILSTASQASATSSTSIEVTISQQLEAGLYFLAVNCSATAPSINFYTENDSMSIGGTTFNGLETKMTNAQTLGTWPNTPAITYAANTSYLHPQIWMRV